MQLKKLHLRNYRSYIDSTLNFEKSRTILLGQNAQGKTNLLEAIFFFATTKSFRISNESDLIHYGEDSAIISGIFERRSTLSRVDIQINRNRPKEIKVNSASLQRIHEYIGQINVVAFTPDDLQLIKGAPSDRRRFLDILLSQTDPSYCRDLATYIKILKQRNALLKHLRLSREDKSLIEPWTHQLAYYGARIIMKRKEALPILENSANKNLKFLTGEAEKFALRYSHSALDTNDYNDTDQLKAYLITLMELHLPDELNRASSLYGPHKDDFHVTINNYPVRNYGSQGQHRSVVLSLKAAEVDYLYSQTGDYPILLLDDVLSELDYNRQNALLNMLIDNVQTIITTTDLNSVDHNRYITDYQVLSIENHEIKPI